MDDNESSTIADNQGEHQDQDAATDDEKARGAENGAAVHASWVAYELLLPFLERSENVRTLFRTSGELHKLCSRLVGVLKSLERPTSSSNSACESNDKNQELIVNAMINCTAAAMGNCSLNQIAMHQNTLFRKHMLAALVRTRVTTSGSQAKSDSKPANASVVLPWSTRASILSFFEETVECKSWKRVTTATQPILPTLLMLIELSEVRNGSVATTTKFDQLSKQNLVPSAFSVCFTLSSDDHGIKAFVQEPHSCIQAIATALTTWQESRDSRTLSNLLGFLTNLSTVEDLRAAVEMESAGQQRLSLTRDLLGITQEFTASSNNTKSTVNSDAGFAIARRTAEPELPCRCLHLIRFNRQRCRDRTREHFRQRDRKTRELWQVAAHSVALGQSALPIALRYSNQCKQWHQASDSSRQRRVNFGAAHRPRAVGTALPGVPPSAVALYQQQQYQYQQREPISRRDVAALCADLALRGLATELSSGREATSHETAGARERLVGNIVKVLIMMQPDRNPQDAKLFGSNKSLKTLVNALQGLLDGLARKNVAILLAKLCQADGKAKDQVRELRGIGVMLAASQSLKTADQKGD